MSVNPSIRPACTVIAMEVPREGNKPDTLRSYVYFGLSLEHGSTKLEGTRIFDILASMEKDNIKNHHLYDRLVTMAKISILMKKNELTSDAQCMAFMLGFLQARKDNLDEVDRVFANCLFTTDKQADIPYSIYDIVGFHIVNI